MSGPQALEARAPPWPGLPGLWGPRVPPQVILAPICFSYLQKNRFAAQTRVLALLAGIFDLVAQSTILRTVLGELLLGK